MKIQFLHEITSWLSTSGAPSRLAFSLHDSCQSSKRRQQWLQAGQGWNNVIRLSDCFVRKPTKFSVGTPLNALNNGFCAIFLIGLCLA
jgi:hypothetical protein